MVLLQRNHAKQAGKDKAGGRKEPVINIKTDGDDKPPHLLEVQSNCLWAPIRSHLLNQISIIADRDDLPPVGHKLCRRIGEFVVEIRPPAKESTTLPPNLQSENCKSLPAIRIMITKAGASAAAAPQESPKLSPAPSVSRSQITTSPTAKAIPNKLRGPPGNITIQNVVSGSSIFPQGTMIASSSQSTSTVCASPFGLSSLSRLNINAPGCVKQGEGSLSVQTRLTSSSATSICNLNMLGGGRLLTESRETTVSSSVKEQRSDSSPGAVSIPGKRPGESLDTTQLKNVRLPLSLTNFKDKLHDRLNTIPGVRMYFPNDPLKILKNKSDQNHPAKDSSDDEGAVGIYVMSANGDVKHVKTKVGTGIRKEDFEECSTKTKGVANADGPPPAKRVCDDSDSNIQSLTDALNQPALSIKRKLSASELPNYSWDEIRRLSVDYKGKPSDSLGNPIDSLGKPSDSIVVNQTVMSSTSSSTITSTGTVQSEVTPPPVVTGTIRIPCSNPQLYNQQSGPTLRPPLPVVCSIPRRGPGPRIRLPMAQRTGLGCGPRIRIPLSMLQSQGAKALTLGQPVTVNLSSATSPPAFRAGYTNLMTVPPAIRLPAPMGQTIQRIKDGQVVNSIENSTGSPSPKDPTSQPVSHQTGTGLPVALPAQGFNSDIQNMEFQSTPLVTMPQSLSEDTIDEKASESNNCEKTSECEAGQVREDIEKPSKNTNMSHGQTSFSFNVQDNLTILPGENSIPSEPSEPSDHSNSNKTDHIIQIKISQQDQSTTQFETTDQVIMSDQAKESNQVDQVVTSDQCNNSNQADRVVISDQSEVPNQADQSTNSKQVDQVVISDQSDDSNQADQVVISDQSHNSSQAEQVVISDQSDDSNQGDQVVIPTQPTVSTQADQVVISDQSDDSDQADDNDQTVYSAREASERAVSSPVNSSTGEDKGPVVVLSDEDDEVSSLHPLSFQKARIKVETRRGFLRIH